jgi:23S rRNA (uracil1939-C5)-methyltransferase
MKSKLRQSRGKAAIRPAQESASRIDGPLLVRIEKPIYGGAFLARIEGKAIFVPLTLPGEQARVRITQDKRGYATAESEEIVVAAPERVEPACPYFAACGGCHYQHADYATQLALKQSILRETLQRAGVQPPSSVAVIAGNPWQYRNRIRLAFDAAGNPGYRGRRSHAVIPISECPIAAPLLLQATRAAASIVRESVPALRPIEIALFCNADETALLASVFIANHAQIRFDDFCHALQERIPALQGAKLVTEGRAGQPSRTLANWGATSLTYRAAGFAYRVDHGAFFQVNRFLVDALVDSVTAGHSGKLAWDLFAGVGLFARRLTQSYERVVAVESAPSAIPALDSNLSATPGTAVRSTTLDFLRHSRTLERPNLIVVDPPRTGLGPEITSLLAEIAAPTLVYVSCDPATLGRDLRALLAAGYSIHRLTLADLFPQTFHLETIVELRRS